MNAAGTADACEVAPEAPLAEQLHLPAVGAVSLVVADLCRSLRFYREVLSFRQIGPEMAETTTVGADHYAARTVQVGLGDELLELTQFCGVAGRPVPTDSRANDRWFQHVAIVVSDMRRAHARLVDAGTTLISAGPQRLPCSNRDAAGIVALYFKDPDGHPLELIHFPAGKGDRKWHQGGPLLQGIDHTAIVVADTGASLRFYRDGLGLRIVGQGLNHGPEQERLSGVASACVRITSLRAQSGPGIELLEYLSPRVGRPRPAGGHVYDLGRSRTRIAVRRSEPTSVGSIVHSSKRVATLVCDPDGHSVLTEAR
jgi:catechol 2,3-dioxygenase-like lactoylglutathione lyase family enzyme